RGGGGRRGGPAARLLPLHEPRPGKLLAGRPRLPRGPRRGARDRGGPGGPPCRPSGGWGGRAPGRKGDPPPPRRAGRQPRAAEGEGGMTPAFFHREEEGLGTRLLLSPLALGEVLYRSAVRRRLRLYEAGRFH